MSEKTIETRFSMDMDACLSGIEKQNESESKEYQILLEFGKTLAANDFSQASHKEEVFAKTLKNINEYGGKNIMSRLLMAKFPVSKIATVAMVCILGFGIMQTSFAQELADKVLKSISLGHVTVYEEDRDKVMPIPAKLTGEYFDRDGNPIEEFSPDGPQLFYSADGKVVIGFGAKEAEEGKLIVKDPDKLNDYTCFNVALPSYLPEGFTFDKAEFYEDENDIVKNTKYIGLYFANKEAGTYIYMQQRLADAETAYEAGGSNVEAIKVNGADAIMYSDRNLDGEANGVIYALSGRGVVPKSELLKIAESI